MRNRQAKPSLFTSWVMFLLCVFSVSLRADQTFTVTNNTDSGAGSLRWALTEPCTGIRTVNFTIYNQVIELASPLTVTGATAIIASDHGSNAGFGEGCRLTISGGGSVRPLIVSPGASLRLQSLTVANGSAEEGGAIYNDGGDLRVVRCTLLNNSATRGGAIYNNGGTNVLNTCTLSGNTAARGGVVYNDGGFARLQYVTACENSASDLGGVLYTDGGSNIVHRSILWSNEAPACATAPAYSTQIADANSATLSVTQCIIEGGYPGYYDSTGLPQAGGFEQNPMPYNLDIDPVLGPLGYPRYSGIEYLGVGDYEKVNTIPCSTMMYEPLPGSPAHWAIYGFDNNADWLADADDQLEQRGGWHRNDDKEEILGSCIGSCFTGFRNPYWFGGGDYTAPWTNYWGELQWERNTSQATEVLTPFQPITFTITTPYSPPISYEGGKVFFEIPENATGPTCTIEPNPATIAADGTVTFTPVANGYAGSHALTAYVRYHPPHSDFNPEIDFRINLTNSKGQHLVVTNDAEDNRFGSFKWAVANVAESGLITFDGDYTIAVTQPLSVLYNIDGEDHNIVFTGNGTTPVMTVGGNNSAVTIQNVTIADGWNDHYLSSAAAGADVRNGDISFINCTFRNNHGYYGGALSINQITSVDEHLNLKLINCVFDGNKATEKGGALRLQESDAEIDVINCTFFGNEAAAGGAVYNMHPGFIVMASGMRQRFSNCIFWDNTAASFPTIHTEVGSGSNAVTFANCDIQNAFPSGAWDTTLGINGGGNIAADPQFVDAAYSNLSLVATSPCINAGSNGLVPTNVTEDIAGNQRIADSTVDMGAYETPYIVTVTFNANGGTPATISSNYVEGLAIGVLPVVARTGYTFAAWTNGLGGTVTSESIVSRIATNLYARWNGNTYAVAFDKQSGTGGSNGVTATYGSSMPTATAPSRTGYTFGGYWDAISGGTQYYSVAMASLRTWDKATPATLYARWTANSYTVTLDPQSGTGGSASVSATYGSAMPTATAPSRTGYTFGGYWDAISGGTQYYSAAMASLRIWDKATAATLYARWAANTYTVVYNGNGSSGGATASSEHTYDTASPLTLNGFTRDGYTFIGWNKAANGSGTSYADGTTVLNLTDVSGATVTLYAQWAPYGTIRDQINDNVGNYFLNVTSGWQSFTAGADGYLSAVSLYVYSYGAGTKYSGGPDWTGTLAVYAGTGTGGALLASQPISGTGAVQFPNFFLGTPPKLAAGGVYTLAILNASAGLTFRASANLYAGGRCGFNAGYDLAFATYLMASDWADAAYRDTSFTVSSSVISNAAQLAQFAWLVNGGETYAGRTLSLVGDINLAPHFWVPAGTSLSVRFEGTFDGAGYCVSGIRIDDPTADYRGLFGCVGTNGAIRNLSIASFDISGHAYVGGIAGRSFGSLSNCTALAGGTVSGTSYPVGGVAGSVEGALRDCANGATVVDSAGTGGSVGGVAGEARDTVANCRNSGTVSGGYYAGGVIATAYGSVQNCTNDGTITSAYAGGVVGRLVIGGTLLNSANYGSVSGSSSAGGVARFAEIATVMENCFNIGAVTGPVDAVGGLLGKNRSTLKSSYWKMTGTAPFTLGAVADVGGSSSGLQPFGDAPGTLAAAVTVGGVTTDRLSAALNAWVAAAWTPGCGLSSWTAGTAMEYPSLVPATELGGAVIPQTLSDRFMAGLTAAQIDAAVAAYTAAYPGTTAAAFGSLLGEADAMGFTYTELAAGNTILAFSPSISIVGFDLATRTLTFSVGNGIDASATAAMNRLAASTAGALRVLQSDTPSGATTPLIPSVEFHGDGTAEAAFTLPTPPESAFFQMKLEHQP